MCISRGSSHQSYFKLLPSDPWLVNSNYPSSSCRTVDVWKPQRWKCNNGFSSSQTSLHKNMGGKPAFSNDSNLFPSHYQAITHIVCIIFLSISRVLRLIGHFKYSKSTVSVLLPSSRWSIQVGQAVFFMWLPDGVSRPTPHKPIPSRRSIRTQPQPTLSTLNPSWTAAPSGERSAWS